MQKKIDRLKELVGLAGFLTAEQKEEIKQLAKEVREEGVDLKMV